MAVWPDVLPPEAKEAAAQCHLVKKWLNHLEINFQMVFLKCARQKLKCCHSIFLSL